MSIIASKIPIKIKEVGVDIDIVPVHDSDAEIVKKCKEEIYKLTKEFLSDAFNWNKQHLALSLRKSGIQNFNNTIAYGVNTGSRDRFTMTNMKRFLKQKGVYCGV